MSFVTLSKSCTFSGGLMYIFQMLDEENKLIFGSRIVTMYD